MLSWFGQVEETEECATSQHKDKVIQCTSETAFGLLLCGMAGFSACFVTHLCTKTSLNHFMTFLSPSLGVLGGWDKIRRIATVVLHSFQLLLQFDSATVSQRGF